MKKQSFQEILEKELQNKAERTSSAAKFSPVSPLESSILDLAWDIDLSFQVRLRKKAAPYQASMSVEERKIKQAEVRRKKLQKLPIDVQVAWMNLCDIAEEAGLGTWEITEAKSLFRRLALKFHPDHCQKPNAADLFRQIISDFNKIQIALEH